MKEEKAFNKKTIHAYVIMVFVIIIFITVGLIMLRYYAQGERNLPFEIKQIDIISTVNGIPQRNEEGEWYTELFQKNDIYFYIVKNDGNGREEAIRSIVFENFRIVEYNDTGNVQIYRQHDIGKYLYTEEYIVTDRLEYIGSAATNISEMKINNQGGLIGFSVVIKELGQYFFETEGIFSMDGTLLGRVDVSLEDITLTIYFDIIIEIGSGNSFRTEYRIELPVGNILEDGMSQVEMTDNMIFRRI